MVYKIITASGTAEREGGREGKSWRKGAGENIKCLFAFNLNIDRLDISGRTPQSCVNGEVTWRGELGNWGTGWEGSVRLH